MTSLSVRRQFFRWTLSEELTHELRGSATDTEAGSSKSKLGRPSKAAMPEAPDLAKGLLHLSAAWWVRRGRIASSHSAHVDTRVRDGAIWAKSRGAVELRSQRHEFMVAVQRRKRQMRNAWEHGAISASIVPISSSRLTVWLLAARFLSDAHREPVRLDSFPLQVAIAVRACRSRHCGRDQTKKKVDAVRISKLTEQWRSFTERVQSRPSE